MKRITAFLLCLSLIAGLFACARNAPEDPGLFYYYRTETAYDADDGVIAPEERELSGIRGDVGALLSAYLAGPTTAGLESPFPRGTLLLSWKIQDDALYLNFNSNLAALSGIELTIACACLSRTFLNLLSVSKIVITANGALLSGETSLILTDDSLRYYDDGLDLLRQSYTVYYTDAQRRYLIGQEIELDLTSQEDLLPQLIESLQEPPAGSGLYATIPLTATVLGVSLEDGLCTVDFSHEFETNGWNRYTAQRLTLMAVVNTLTQLEEIDRVEFCVEGSLLAQYRMVSIPAALEWDEAVIGPVRTGVNEFDATLYLDDGNGQYLVPIPTRLRQSTGITQAELVVQALIGYQSRNGLSSVVPKGTTVRHVSVSNGICRIDLSSDFLSTTDHLPLSLRSIIGSVCALDGIEGVQVTVNGTIPEGYEAYFEAMTPETDWFA